METGERATAAKATGPRPTDDAGELDQTARAYRAKCGTEARGNLRFFIEYVIRDGTGNAIQLEEVHREGLAFIADAQAAGKFPVIMAPWGSGKTTNYIVALSLWAIGHDPNVRIGIFSNEEGLAADRVEAIKGYIDDSKEFRATFPEVIPNMERWGAHGLLVKRTSRDPTPTVSPKGILGSKVGPRYDLIFCDDITDFENSVYSSAKRKAVDQRLHNTVMGRLSKSGNFLAVATAWHSQDAIENLKKDDRFVVLVQSVNDDCSAIEQENLATGERKSLPLPITLDRTRLIHEKINRPREFARGRQQRAYTEEEKTFNAEAIEAAIEDVGSVEKLPKGIGVDLSTPIRPGNALVPGAWDEDDQRLIVMDCVLLKATSPEVCANAVEMWRTIKADFVKVENNAYQESFIQWGKATRTEAVPWESHTTGRNKADLNLGLPGLAAAVVADGIKFLWPNRPDECKKGVCECRSGICKLIKDLKAHPFGDTDSIMALWFLWHRFRSKGGAASVRSGNASSQPRERRLYSPRENIGRHRRQRRRLI
jgi:hypothetical protein